MTLRNLSICKKQYYLSMHPLLLYLSYILLHRKSVIRFMNNSLYSYHVTTSILAPSPYLHASTPVKVSSWTLTLLSGVQLQGTSLYGGFLYIQNSFYSPCDSAFFFFQQELGNTVLNQSSLQLHRNICWICKQLNLHFLFLIEFTSYFRQCPIDFSHGKFNKIQTTLGVYNYYLIYFFCVSEARLMHTYSLFILVFCLVYWTQIQR